MSLITDGAASTLQVQEFSPVEFERHGGFTAAKKWKHTVRIDDDTLMDNRLGKWMEKRGLLPAKGAPMCAPLAPLISHQRCSGAVSWEP